jgi:hypothetical protein
LTYSGGSFPPYGTCEIICSATVSGKKTNWDRLTIKVKGGDNNGYSFEKSKYYTYGSGNKNTKVSIESPFQ